MENSGGQEGNTGERNGEKINTTKMFEKVTGKYYFMNLLKITVS